MTTGITGSSFWDVVCKEICSAQEDLQNMRHYSQTWPAKDTHTVSATDDAILEIKSVIETLTEALTEMVKFRKEQVAELKGQKAA